jgi:hypothetical protein
LDGSDICGRPSIAERLELFACMGVKRFRTQLRDHELSHSAALFDASSVWMTTGLSGPGKFVMPLRALLIGNLSPAPVGLNFAHGLS